MTWNTLRKHGWFFSPKLEAWQKKVVAEMQARVPRAADVLWILSSGTQSVNTVKAIGLSEEAVLASAEGVNRHLSSNKNDRWLVAIPWYHVGGLSIYARASLSGAKVFEFTGKWSAESFAKAVDKNKITLTSLVPTQVFDLVACKVSAPSSLRAAVIGGGALEPRLYQEARALGWPVLPSYGLTECSSQVATASLRSLKSEEFPGLKVLPHAKVELRDQRVLIKSTALCRWIAVGSREGQFTLENPLRKGWFATEDSAEWMAKRELRPLGRRDSVVKVLGVLVPVQDVEYAAGEFFARSNWREPFVIAAVPSPREGTRLILFTDSKRTLGEWETKMAAYNDQARGPQRIFGPCWIPEIPRNELGKIKRAELLRLF